MKVSFFHTQQCSIFLHQNQYLPITLSMKVFIEMLLLEMVIFNLARYSAIFRIRYPAGYPASQI
jgi:hypothetical protein